MNPQTFTVVVEIFCCVFAAAVLVYVFLPSRDSDSGVDKTRVVYLYERKEVVYENLRDLNFEYRAGKYPEEDFREQRSQLENETAQLVAEMDHLERQA